MFLSVFLMFTLIFTSAGALPACERYEVAYIGDDENSQTDIFVADIFSGEIQRVTDDDFKENQLSWSPDGNFIATVISTEIDGKPESHTLTVVDIDSGVKRAIFTSDSIYNLQWSPDGNRIAFLSAYQPFHSLYTISPDGSNLVRYPAGRFVEAFAWSLDSSHIAITARDELWLTMLYLARIADAKVTRTGLKVDLFTVSWMSDNRVTLQEFTRDSRSFYLVDPFAENITPIKLVPLPPISPEISVRVWGFEWSPSTQSGEAVFVDLDDIWLYRDGSVSNLTQNPQEIYWVEWSPDGRFVAFSVKGYADFWSLSTSFREIHVMNLNTREITISPLKADNIVWRPCHYS